MIAMCFSSPSEELHTRPQCAHVLLVVGAVGGASDSGCACGKLLLAATTLRMEG